MSSSQSEKKSARVVYDRSGTRYWCIQADKDRLETGKNFSENSDSVALVPKSRDLFEEATAATLEEVIPFENCLSELKSILEESAEFIEKSSTKIDASIHISPGKMLGESFSSSLNSKGDKNFARFENEYEKALEYSSSDNDEDSSIFRSFKEKMIAEAQEEYKRKERNVISEKDEGGSLWRSQSIREERALAVEHWKLLPPKQQRKILKMDGDCKTFFTTHLNAPKSSKNSTIVAKHTTCTCIECDPKRSFMQVQFEAFYTRYRIAQSIEFTSKGEKLGLTSDKIFKEAAETKFFDGSLDELKKKIFNVALQMITNNNEGYIEISKKLLYDQSKVMAACTEDINVLSLTKSDNESKNSIKGTIKDGKLHLCIEHTKEKDHSGFPYYKMDRSTRKPISCTDNCEHSPLSGLAANMLGFGNQSSKSPNESDDSSKDKMVEDKAPFPAANPPEGMTSSWSRCGDKECNYGKTTVTITGSSDSDKEAVMHFEKIKNALKNSVNDEHLMKIYVTKLFDHRIVNYYREMLVQRRQEKLIEEIEQEEKSKLSAATKKGKKKNVKNAKKFEEELERKQREAEAERQKQLRREAETLKQLERQRKLEEEMEAEIQLARAKNLQEEADRMRKASKLASSKPVKGRTTLGSVPPGSGQESNKTMAAQKSSKVIENKKHENSYSVPKKCVPEVTNSTSRSTKPKTVSTKSKIHHPINEKINDSKREASSSPITKKKIEQLTDKKQVKTLNGPMGEKQNKAEQNPENRTVNKKIVNMPKDTPQLKPQRTEAWKTVSSSPSVNPKKSYLNAVSAEKSNIVDTNSLSEFPALLSDKKQDSPSTNSKELKMKNPSDQFNENGNIIDIDSQIYGSSTTLYEVTNSSFSSMGPPGMGNIHNHPVPYPSTHGFGAQSYGTTPYSSFNGSGYTSMHTIPNSGVNDPYRGYSGFTSNQLPYSNFSLSNYTGPWSTDNSLFNALSPFSQATGEPVAVSGSNDISIYQDINPSNDSRVGISNQLIQQTQEHARHAYFSLLIDMGISLSAPLQDRPFFPLNKLFEKYRDLFVDGLSSIGTFYQLLSFAIPDLDSATSNTSGLSLPSNHFQFQPDMEQIYPQVKFSSIPNTLSNSEMPPFKSNFFTSFNLGPKIGNDFNNPIDFLGKKDVFNNVHPISSGFTSSISLSNELANELSSFNPFIPKTSNINPLPNEISLEPNDITELPIINTDFLIDS